MFKFNCYGVGRLASDMEFKELSSDWSVLKFCVVAESKGRKGDRESEPIFLNSYFYFKTGASVGETLLLNGKKGALCSVSGRLIQEFWDEGKRSMIKMVCDSLIFHQTVKSKKVDSQESNVDESSDFDKYIPF